MQHSEEQAHNLGQQEEIAEQPAATNQQTQGQGPPVQEKVVEISVLQTPANEERIKKRDRQEETPLANFNRPTRRKEAETKSFL